MKWRGIVVNVGDTLVMKLSTSDKLYRCKVIDFIDDFIAIDHPINIQTNKSITLPKHAKLIINYIKDGNIYEFPTTIVRQTKINIPALLINRPNKDDIRRIQRREFVRVQTDVDIAVHCPNKTFTPFTTVTGDISGGGALIITPPKKVDFRPKQKVELFFSLRYDDEPYKYVHTTAEIVLVRQINAVKTFSVKFLLPSERMREQIINYCFYVQRKRQKERKV